MLSKEIMKGPLQIYYFCKRYFINYSESPKAELDPINFSIQKIISDWHSRKVE
jgi:hypothetical protein